MFHSVVEVEIMSWGDVVENKAGRKTHEKTNTRGKCMQGKKSAVRT